MFFLQGFDISLASLQPRPPHSLNEACFEAFHIGALFGDKLVLWCVGLSYDEVGHVRGEIELVDRTHSLSGCGEIPLFRGIDELARDREEGGLVASLGV